MNLQQNRFVISNTQTASPHRHTLPYTFKQNNSSSSLNIFFYKFFRFFRFCFFIIYFKNFDDRKINIWETNNINQKIFFTPLLVVSLSLSVLLSNANVRGVLLDRL